MYMITDTLMDTIDHIIIGHITIPVTSTIHIMGPMDTIVVTEGMVIMAADTMEAVITNISTKHSRKWRIKPNEVLCAFLCEIIVNTLCF